MKIIILLLNLFLICNLGFAMQVTVDDIAGDVEVRRSGGFVWEDISKGMILNAGDFVSTGYESGMRLLFEDNSVVDVRQLTQMKIDEFTKQDNKVKTKLILDIGNVRAKVEKTDDIKSDFVVTTPTSVIAVRGTDEELTASDMGTSVYTHEGVVEAQTKQGRSVMVGKLQETMVLEKNLTLPTDEANKNSRSDLIKTSGITDEEQKAKESVEEPVNAPGFSGTTDTEETNTFLNLHHSGGC